jgi:predicted transcriptional regulator
VQEREAKQMALQAFLKEAIDDAEAGRVMPMDDVFDDLLAELTSMKDAKYAG